MKFTDLVARLEEEGCVFVRHGGQHDIYRNVITGRAEAVPRHRAPGNSSRPFARWQKGI